MSDYTQYFEDAKLAVGRIVDDAIIDVVLADLANTILTQTALLLQENQKDLDRMDPTDSRFDRLKLSESRIGDMAKEVFNVVHLKSPLGRILLDKKMPNGLHISKVSVPLGIVGVIYESRPNVTLDVFTLCFKSGNVCVLKGGSDAEYSNRAIISIIGQVLSKHRLDINIVTLLPPDREATAALLNAVGYVDVLIPRGSQQLINYVRQHSKVPVIETGAGIVHVYFDEYGDLEKGRNIILNSKTRRVSVCNALDCLLVHYKRLKDLPKLLAPLAKKHVELYADNILYNILKFFYPPELLHLATADHFGTEFLSMKMSIKTVYSFDEALGHIAKHSSKHSEAIVTEDEANMEMFLNRVDAAAVYVNASTAFTDGAQFGLGAEIGISTQKLHARGPMGLDELTSYKWIIKGDGQTRD